MIGRKTLYRSMRRILQEENLRAFAGDGLDLKAIGAARSRAMLRNNIEAL